MNQIHTMPARAMFDMLMYRTAYTQAKRMILEAPDGSDPDRLIAEIDHALGAADNPIVEQAIVDLLNGEPMRPVTSWCRPRAGD